VFSSGSGFRLSRACPAHARHAPGFPAGMTRREHFSKVSVKLCQYGKEVCFSIQRLVAVADNDYE